MTASPAITGNEYIVKSRKKPTISEIKYWIRQNGPVVAKIYAPDDWQNWKNTGKQIYDKSCIGDFDHVVNLVRYDISPRRVKYWIVRNSWGSKYGDKGYYYVMEKQNDKDCGIKESIHYLKSK